MGFNFRKSIKIGPARVSLSKSGVGYSFGGKGLRVTKKASGGTRTTIGIPGTGISYSKDSSQKRASKESTPTASKTHTSSSESTSESTKGWITPFLWFIGICLAVVFLKEYFAILILVGLLCGTAYLLFRFFRGQKALPESASNIAATSDPETAAIEYPRIVSSTDNSTVQKISWQKREEEEEAYQKAAKSANEVKKAEFGAALAGIPKVDISLSEPVPRNKLKDIPEYTFSNITRKTRLDSIFPLVVLDVETTGFAPSKCEIVEVAAIKFEKGMEPVAAFTTLCKPKKPIPEEATAVNNITDDMVADAPEFSRIAPALTDFLKGCHIAGHNLDFDLRFIFAHGADLPTGTRFYDTLDLAHLTIPESQIWNYKLKTICSYYGIIPSDSHRSLSDAYATSKVFSHLVLDKTDRQLDDNEEILSEKDAE